jgi:hypothetical protein
VSKLSGLGTAATMTAGTAANNVVQLDGSGRLPAVNGANLTGVSTDTSAMENNIAILAFKTQSANNLAKFNLVDQVIDEYKDDAGLATKTNTGVVGTTATEGYIASVVAGVGAFTSDSDTMLLIHSDTSNGSTTFADSSSNTHSMSLKGSMTHSTTEQKIGASSLKFNGSCGLIIATGQIVFPASNWTMEFWIKHPIVSKYNARVVGHYPGNNNNQFFLRPYSEIDANGYGLLYNGWGGTSGNFTGTPFSPEAILTGLWVHVAIVQEGSNNRAFINGVNKMNVALNSSNNSGNPTASPADAWGIGFNHNNGGNEYLANNVYMDEIRFSSTARYPGTTTFTPNEVSVTSATGTAISTANTALTAPTTGDICMLIENAAGTATLNTDLKAYVSRNGGTGWDQVTLADKGSWGTNKKILTANNVAFSNSASGTDMRYKIEWANQGSGTKETRVHATSLAWA